MAQTNRTTVLNSWADEVEEEEEVNQSAGQIWNPPALAATKIGSKTLEEKKSCPLPESKTSWAVQVEEESNKPAGQVWNIAAPTATKTGWKELEDKKNFPTLGSSPLPKTKTPKWKTPEKNTLSSSTQAKKSTKWVSLPVEIVDTSLEPQTQSQPKPKSKRAQNPKIAGAWRERAEPSSSTPASTPEKETIPKWNQSGTWSAKRPAAAPASIPTSTPVAIPTLTPEEQEKGWKTVIPRPTPRAKVGLPPRRPARAKGTVIGSLRREREEREHRAKSEKKE